MNEVMPGQRWRARFDTTLLTMIRRSVDNQWLTQNHTDFQQAWYYTRHILDDFVLVDDGYYPTPSS